MIEDFIFLFIYFYTDDGCEAALKEWMVQVWGMAASRPGKNEVVRKIGNNDKKYKKYWMSLGKLKHCENNSRYSIIVCFAYFSSPSIIYPVIKPLACKGPYVIR